MVHHISICRLVWDTGQAGHHESGLEQAVGQQSELGLAGDLDWSKQDIMNLYWVRLVVF